MRFDEEGPAGDARSASTSPANGRREEEEAARAKSEAREDERSLREKTEE
jgi:hypothetical protein